MILPLYKKTAMQIAVLLCLFHIQYAQGDEHIRSLASDETWLKLGHYEQTAFIGNGLKSAIHSDEFFLHPKGETHPYEELKETIKMMHSSSDLDDGSVWCLFPARALWIQKKLGNVSPKRPEGTCAAFNKWTRNQSYSSVSLVFATGYLDNPASYYGHTLLKINFPKGKSDRLRDITLNYGAIMEGSDNPATYIAKGIFGGYDGGFSEVEYYVHRNIYGETEDRDMWDYQLDVKKEDLDFIIAHAWEVLGKRYIYYFFKRNCAYRTAEILNIVDGIDSIQEYYPWTIPQAVIQTLSEHEWSNGDELVSDIRRDPSRTSRFHTKLREMDRQELSVFKSLGSTKSLTSNKDYSSMHTESKIRVIDALLDYADLRMGEDINEITSFQRALMGERFKLPIAEEVDENVGGDAIAPHIGRPPSLIQVGYVDSHHGLSGYLRIRPAYYDPLDVSKTTERVDGLSMGDTVIDFDDGVVRLNRFDLVHIESVKKGYSGLKGDRSTAWNMSIGAQQISLDCNDCLTPKIALSGGIGNHFTPTLYGALYAGGALQAERHDHGFGYAALAGRVIFKPTRRTGVRADIEHRFSTSGVIGNYTVLKMEGRMELSRRFDIRLNYTHDVESAMGAVVGYYW